MYSTVLIASGLALAQAIPHHHYQHHGAVIAGTVSSTKASPKTKINLGQAQIKKLNKVEGGYWYPHHSPKKFIKKVAYVPTSDIYAPEPVVDDVAWVGGEKEAKLMPHMMYDDDEEKKFVTTPKKVMFIGTVPLLPGKVAVGSPKIKIGVTSLTNKDQIATTTI